MQRLLQSWQSALYKQGTSACLIEMSGELLGVCVESVPAEEVADILGAANMFRTRARLDTLNIEG